MYLLMLLATFMASLYGYNLSARPDYDRDMARKKAAAVIYKFIIHHNTLKKVGIDINLGVYEAEGIDWVLPNDLFYTDFDDSSAQDNEDIHTFLASGGDKKMIYLRAHDKKGSLNPGGRNYLNAGRQMYDGAEMASKVICLDKQMNEPDSKNCTPATDANGNITGTCCDLAKGGRFLVSYKKLDARWINRINGDVSLDFISALNKKQYYERLGVIHWGKGIESNKDGWIFKGKINFIPVFADDMEKWDQEHADSGRDSYPVERRNRSYWEMPTWIFDEHFFKDKDGKDLCSKQQPCIFKIESF